MILRRFSRAAILLTVWMLVLSVASAVRAAEVTVHLENAPTQGTLTLALFNSPNTFGNFRDPIKEIRLPLDGRPIYRLENLPSGEYALLVYHDQNNNARIDKNFIGIPKEPLAFSNSYRPKGPPSYKRAAFTLHDNQPAHFDVELLKPLGELGRIGVGAGVIGRSSPYRDYDGGVYQAIPSIVYTGNRLQIYGPNAQLGLIGSGKLRFAVKGRYRMGVYEEKQSDFLTGMGDAEATFMAGPALNCELPADLYISVEYLHDALSRIGGAEAKLTLSKSIQRGLLRISPNASINWLSPEMGNNDFGVSTEDAIPGRPAYKLNSAYSLETGAGLFVEITPDWILLINASIEVFDREVTRSPIISDDYVVKGFCALSYIF